MEGTQQFHPAVRTRRGMAIDSNRSKDRGTQFERVAWKAAWRAGCFNRGMGGLESKSVRALL
jgi:hypothetical protein